MTLKRGQKLNKILIIQYLKGKLNFKAMEQIILDLINKNEFFNYEKSRAE